MLIAKENKIMLTDLDSITDLDRKDWLEKRQNMNEAYASVPPPPSKLKRFFP
jgi:hypothetical protein